MQERNIVLRNKKTKEEYPVSQEHYDKLVELGRAGNYVKVPGGKVKKQPQEVAKADYETLYRQAEQAEQDGNIPNAIALYEQAKAVKATKDVKEALARLKEVNK